MFSAYVIMETFRKVSGLKLRVPVFGYQGEWLYQQMSLFQLCNEISYYAMLQRTCEILVSKQKRVCPLAVRFPVSE